MIVPVILRLYVSLISAIIMTHFGCVVVSRAAVSSALGNVNDDIAA